MVEAREETTYVPHHKKKIALVLSAMRHFAQSLRQAGWTVTYIELDDPDNSGSLTEEAGKCLTAGSFSKLILTEPGEWRLREAFLQAAEHWAVPLEMREDQRFICTQEAFSDWAAGRKQLRMEYFYRDMRRKTGLLMDGTKPEGGQWNYDADNRKAAGSDLFMPEPYRVRPDEITTQVLRLVETHFASHFGDLTPFWFGVTSQAAQNALQHFIEAALPFFGDYQDAMLEGEKFLYHAVISPYLNIGLLDPLETCQQVEKAYYDGRVPLNAAEGFIRQIIGWREYIRGIYWLKMPFYDRLNYFGNTRPLPDFYWTGQTDMACMRATIAQTRQEAYAHHIQRLMVTGNFALLAGIDPYQVHHWYLSVYADAYEWVELPNTLGMSQFADGGLLASKPYAASGNYIHKMSNHCKTCSYDVKQKTGPQACPFNPLYWDFLNRNRARLAGNPRMAQMYRVWDRMSEEKKAEYLKSAQDILSALQA